MGEGQVWGLCQAVVVESHQPLGITQLREMASDH